MLLPRRKRAHEHSESPLAKKKALIANGGHSESESSSESGDSSKSLVREAIILPWWFTGISVDRLRTFMEYRDSNLRMALSRVPSAADWGRGRNSSLLCVDGEPIHLWVVGTLQDISYTASDVASRAGCNIVVGLLRDVDREPHLVFHASWVASGGDCLSLFPAVYDATTTFQSKSTMEQLSQRDLVVGDLVLAEANITRRDVGRRRASRGWTTWKVEFTLLAVSRLVQRVLVKKEEQYDNFVVSL